MTPPLREEDLARPLCAFLQAQGYTVRSEVKDCDIAAVREDELVIIELKKSMSLALLAQAARRQRITDSVYVAIPRPANRWKWNAQNRSVVHVLRRLELGLIFVCLEEGKVPVEVAFHPAPFVRRRKAASRRAVLEEIGNRIADFNRAGSTRRRLVTAYREAAIHIACCMVVKGKMSPRGLRAMGASPRTQVILRGNVYGWFERLDRGVYGLTGHGRKDIECWPELKAHYMDLARKAVKAGGGEKTGARNTKAGGSESASGATSLEPLRALLSMGKRTARRRV